MSYYALWVDHQYAYVYKFNAEGVDESTLKAPAHHNHSHQELEKFYHQIAQKVGDAEELMIMGPGIAKDEFKHHCEKHHHNKLAKAIVGVQPMVAHPTAAMMKAEAKNFFKHHHLWTQNY